MTDQFRALCTELIQAWDTAPTSSDFMDTADYGVIGKIRAALADGPAVPDGREPASVTEQPSDDNCWQWYTYCPEEGLEMYSDRKEAQSAAQSIMGSYEVAAHSDGWHEDMESVSWGMLVPVEQAQVIERKTAEPGGEFDEWVKYELRPARYGHQPAPPADGEVAESAAWLRRLAAASWICAVIHDKLLNAADLLERRQAVPVSIGKVATSSVGETVELVPWLLEEAEQAVNSDASYSAGMLTWAAQVVGEHADLLERQATPVPVPVTEGLPGPQDCDAEGRCWVGRAEYDFPMGDTGKYGHADPERCLEKPPTQREIANSPFVWLPAHALPIPSVEKSK